MIRLVRNTPYSIKNEVMSGLLLGFTILAQTILFCTLSGIDYKMGVIGVVFANLLFALFNARPGMIHAPSNLVLLALFPLVAKYGINYLFITVILSGVLQMAFGKLKLGKYIRVLPQHMICAIIAGITVLVFLTFCKSILVPNKEGIDDYLSTTQLIPIGLILVSVFLALTIIPRYFKAIPASLLVAVLICAVFYFIPEHNLSILDYSNLKAQKAYTLPTFSKFPWVPISLETLGIIMPYVLAITTIGILETLFVIGFTDHITNTRGKSNRAMIMQGGATILSGFFGGCPTTGSIGQTMINFNAGGKDRIALVVATIISFTIAFFFEQILQYIPMYLMIGIAFFIVIETFIRASIYQFLKINLLPSVILVLTASTTVFFGLFIGFIIGLVLTAILFAWENARRIRVRKRVDDQGVKYYEMYGPLFFGSAPIFTDKIDVDNDPEEIVFDFLESKVIDYEGAKALFKVIEQYQQQGKKAKLKYISSDLKRLIRKEKIEVEIIDTEEDPSFTMLIDDFS